MIIATSARCSYFLAFLKAKYFIFWISGTKGCGCLIDASIIPFSLMIVNLRPITIIIPRSDPKNNVIKSIDILFLRKLKTSQTTDFYFFTGLSSRFLNQRSNCNFLVLDKRFLKKIFRIRRIGSCHLHT